MTVNPGNLNLPYSDPDRYDVAFSNMQVTINGTPNMGGIDCQWRVDVDIGPDSSRLGGASV
jgi:hypothetical protein